MKIGPFSIVTDGSCDYDDKKLYPVCVRYFDSEKGKVMSVLLSLPELTVDSTGQNIFTACDYMLHKFPYGDKLLLNASVADVNERQSKSFKSVRFFVKRYPFLLPPLSNLDHLEEEFLKYQVGILPDNILNADRVDVQWHLISLLKDSITGRNKFPLLCQVMK